LSLSEILPVYLVDSLHLSVAVDSAITAYFVGFIVGLCRSTTRVLA